MPSVLFVCTANLFRSPICAALFAQKVITEPDSKSWKTSSAGTWARTGATVHLQTIEAVDRLGLELRQHRARQINAKILSENDLILVMEMGHEEALKLEFPEFASKVYLLSRVVDGVEYSIPDPFQSRDVDEGEVISDLEGMLTRGVGRICELARSLTK
jgi:protein-tyrosine phosphatase